MKKQKPHITMDQGFQGIAFQGQFILLGRIEEYGLYDATPLRTAFLVWKRQSTSGYACIPYTGRVPRAQK